MSHQGTLQAGSVNLHKQGLHLGYVLGCLQVMRAPSSSAALQAECHSQVLPYLLPFAVLAVTCKGDHHSASLQVGILRSSKLGHQPSLPGKSVTELPACRGTH